VIHIEKYKRTVAILSIDGGGVRGLIPALVLRELQKKTRTYRRKQKLYQLFDLIAGTSTGALLALGLTAPASPSPVLRKEQAQKEQAQKEQAGDIEARTPALDLEDLVELYTRYGIEIFPSRLFRRFQTVKQVFSEKYDAAPLEAILARLFGVLTVQDALANVLITAYDTERRTPFFFKRRPEHYPHSDDLEFYTRDAARAAAAAPTYFEPALIRPVHGAGQPVCLVDGAVFANNPAMCAYIEARKMYPWARRFIILSLGTGTTVRRFTYAEMRTWGYLDWVSPVKGAPLFGITTDGQSETVTYQLNKLPDVEYYRIDAPLVGCSELLDDASRKNIDGLFRLAYRMMRNNESILDTVVHRITRKGVL
jgi:uncharacterized protein